MNFTLEGEIPAKKNAWKIGKHGIYQSKKKEINDLIGQLQRATMGKSTEPIKTNCMLVLKLWGDNRKDLLGQIETIGDILQEAGIIKNDRLIKRVDAEKTIDNKNPRAIIEIL